MMHSSVNVDSANTTLLLADESAASFWRFSPGRNLESARESLLHAPMKPPSIKAIPSIVAASHPRLAAKSSRQALLRQSGEELTSSQEKWHFLVGSPEARFRTRFADSSVCQNPLPPLSTLRLTPEVSIISPELSFLRMTKYLDPINLVAYGSELCAGYFYKQNENVTAIERRDPLTTPSAISCFLEQASDMAGVAQARKALRYVVPHARSPREIHSALLIGLPRRLGGQGLGMPELNARIEHHPTRNCPHGYFLCDLFWESGKIDVEYEGFECHADRFIEDSIRRNALESLGVTVITLTKSEFRELDDVISIARRITEKSGKRWHQPSNKELERMRSLHKTILLWSSDPAKPPSIF